MAQPGKARAWKVRGDSTSGVQISLSAPFYSILVKTVMCRFSLTRIAIVVRKVMAYTALRNVIHPYTNQCEMIDTLNWAPIDFRCIRAGPVQGLKLVGGNT